MLGVGVGHEREEKSSPTRFTSSGRDPKSSMTQMRIIMELHCDRKDRLRTCDALSSSGGHQKIKDL